MDNGILIELDGACKRFMGVNVLDNVTLEINGSDRIAIMGPNGAGKTTLVRSILGFYHLDSGKIRVSGYDPVKKRVDVLKHVGFIPQLPPPVRLTLEELLHFVERSTGARKAEVISSALKMDLDIKSHMAKPFYKLSGGMKQKMLIAIALAKKSRLLIFDGPTASLDPVARKYFCDLLSQIEHKYAAIYITHRAEELEGLINRKIYMDLGKVVSDEIL